MACLRAAEWQGAADALSLVEERRYEDGECAHLYSYGLYSYGLCSHGLHSYGLNTYGLYRYGIYS